MYIYDNQIGQAILMMVANLSQLPDVPSSGSSSFPYLENNHLILGTSVAVKKNYGH